MVQFACARHQRSLRFDCTRRTGPGSAALASTIRGHYSSWDFALRCADTVLSLHSPKIEGEGPFLYDSLSTSLREWIQQVQVWSKTPQMKAQGAEQTKLAQKQTVLRRTKRLIRHRTWTESLAEDHRYNMPVENNLERSNLCNIICHLLHNRETSQWPAPFSATTIAESSPSSARKDQMIP